MKKILTILSLLAFAAGCGKEPITPEPESDSFRLVVTLPSYDTRTQLDKEGNVYKTTWSNNDVISINGNLSAQLQTDGVKDAEFVFDGYSPAGGDMLNVLYPGSESNRFTIPQQQSYTSGRYPAAAAPMWASVVHPAGVSMNHLCSILSLSFTGEQTVSRMVVTAEGGEKISGEFIMGLENGRYNGLYTGGASPQIDITFEGGISLGNTPVEFLIPVLAGTYAKGFTVRIYNDNGKYSTVKFYKNGAVLDPLAAYVLPSRVYNPDVNTGSVEDYDEKVLFDGNSLSVGTYNILASSARSASTANTWEAARATIAQIINSSGCDVMTLNELFDTEITYLTGALEDYSWVLKHNYDGGYSYAPGIIYNAERLEKLDDGIFWLSKPDATSLQTTQGCYWYWSTENSGIIPDQIKAGEHRCCVWAKFHDSITGRDFYYFAPHPEIRGRDSDLSTANTLKCLNAGNIRSLAVQVPLVNTDSLPMIIAGDMNTWSGHISHTVFVGAGWDNAFTEAVSNSCISPSSLNSPGTDIGTSNYVFSENRRIDHIFYSGFQTVSYSTVFTQYSVDGSSHYPSDHLPVKASLSFKPAS